MLDINKVECSITGTNYCPDTYLILLVVRHLLNDV